MYKSKMTGIIRRNKRRQLYTLQDVMEYMKCDRSEALQEIERIEQDSELSQKVKFINIVEG